MSRETGRPGSRASAWRRASSRGVSWMNWCPTRMGLLASAHVRLPGTVYAVWVEPSHAGGVMHAPPTVLAPGIEPATQVGDELHSPADHPRAFEPITLALTAALSVLGALIGLNLITTLGISANTSVIGALVAMLVGRVNLLGLKKMRSVHRQNLVQSAIS